MIEFNYLVNFILGKNSKTPTFSRHFDQKYANPSSTTTKSFYVHSEQSKQPISVYHTLTTEHQKAIIHYVTCFSYGDHIRHILCRRFLVELSSGMYVLYVVCVYLCYCVVGRTRDALYSHHYLSSSLSTMCISSTQPNRWTMAFSIS